MPGQGVVVNQPPVNGPHAGQGGYVEVMTTRAIRPGFANVLGMSCWLVSARAVASIAATSVAGCGLCVLGSEDTPALSLHGSEKSNAATLRIDGQTYSPARVGFSQNRQRRRTPRGTSSERQEIAIYALPDGVLEQLATARSASFGAGPTEFVFTDDHVTAAAALAARLGRDGADR